MNLEYLCPFCLEWTLKTNFKTHQHSHWNDPNNYKQPESIEELEQRFRQIGLWDER